MSPSKWGHLTVEDEALSQRECRERTAERLQAWLRGLDRCGCPVPVHARSYGGVWQCRLCGKLDYRASA